MNMEFFNNFPEIVRDENAKTLAFHFAQSRHPNIIKNTHIKELVAAGQSSGSIVRLCFHKDQDAKLHKMLIYIPQEHGYDFHMHSDKNESYEVLHGDLTLKYKINADDEDIEISMPSEASHIYMKNNTWHSFRANSEYVLMIESREGPFKPGEKETIYLGGKDA
jgi:cupin fold WbuC family metalloprotein